jgi:SAM-dependent methyltransferase
MPRMRHRGELYETVRKAARPCAEYELSGSYCTLVKYRKVRIAYIFRKGFLMNNNYIEINSKFFDKWVEEGWEWGQPIGHEVYERAKNNDWFVVLTPTKPVPKEWFCEMKNARILGLASGGGQQMPIFSALGANCTVLDYSEKQLQSEKEVAERENYEIEIIKADMTKSLPFENESFDLIFHPVSNSYIEDVLPVWMECYRILKRGGILLAGIDNGMNYIFDDDETSVVNKLPFNPLKDKQLFEKSIKENWAIQFSHTIEEQVGGQLKAGFVLTDIYHDTNGTGKLHEFNVPTFYATRAIKK